jgi:uncharacterized protein (TIGR01777 family)
VNSVFESPMPAPAETLFAWHERPGAFERLAPPWERIEVLEREGGIRDGGRLVMTLRKGPFRLRWVAEHFGYEEGREFRDRQASGPFASWVHRHRCLPDGDGSRLRDEIEWRLRGGAAGRLLAGAMTRRMLARMFRFRHERTRRDLARHAATAGREPLRIAITGASGPVGRALVPFLRGGAHEVVRLVRSPEVPGESCLARYSVWDPAKGVIDPHALEGLDAVIHLASESVARRRWWKGQRERIRRSRIDGTTLLARTLAALERPPAVLVSASSIALYGDRPDEIVDEDSPPGRGFYPDVCRAWEVATAPASEAGIRVVNLRIGRVLTPRGGTLRWLLRPGRLEIGGWVGSGRTPVSWIGLDDLVGVLHHAVLSSSLEGPVNAVAPEPSTQIRLVRAAARATRRLSLLPTLPLLVHLLDGERGRFLRLTGASVRPSRLLAHGFAFAEPDLERAVRWEMGDPGPT